MEYLNIGGLRLLDIKVVKDNEVLYEGMVENAPDDIKAMKYKSIDSISPMILQV